MKEQVALQKILQTKLTECRSKNSAYSIRAFARRAGITPGTLSLILLGKRKASAKLARKISDHLALDPQERSEILSSFPVARVRTQDHIASNYLQLNADQFFIVSEWHYFAILNLMRLKSFRSNPTWIAERLDIGESVVRDALVRLKRLDLIQEDKKGNLSRTANHYRTTDDIANLSLRKSHHQTLELARKSLDTDSVDERDFTWLTFAMDKKKLVQAKTLIRKFQDDLLEILDQDAEQDEVYRLAIQLFPLTKIRNRSKK